VSSVPDNIRTIYIVGGQKGGVGKTAICQALCQYLIDAENRGKQSFTLIEADAQIDDVGRMYRDQVETQTITVSDDPAKRSNPDVIRVSARINKRGSIRNKPSTDGSALEIGA
jgi:cellulose biosynthesis protein BcsQ